jgi:hypothetical protein
MLEVLAIRLSAAKRQVASCIVASPAEQEQQAGKAA